MLEALRDMPWWQWLLLYLVVVGLVLKRWADQKPARDAQDFRDGVTYVQLSLSRHGDSWATRDRLWCEYENGMTFDPTHFEKGTRQALDSLVPLKRLTP